MHDVAVIGDGVAGLAAIRALQHAGHTPLLIAPANARSGNRGELLGPRALSPLTSLGWGHLLDDGQLAMPSVARYSAWGSPALVRQRGDPDVGAGWYVDRTGLEAAMRASIAAGSLHHIAASVQDHERQEDGWRLTLSTGEEVRARFIIDASGRAATIARKLGGQRHRDSRLVAMHRTLALPEADVMAASLIEATPDGWWYTSPVPGQRQLFAALFTDADLLPDRDRRHRAPLADLLAGAPYTHARLESLGAATTGSPWRIVVASTNRQEHVGGDGWAAAGDAAAALDPLAGHGLTVALWSARQAAAAAHAWLEGDDKSLWTYRKAVTAGMTRFTADTDRYYQAERRFHARAFWTRRQHRAVQPELSGS